MFYEKMEAEKENCFLSFYNLACTMLPQRVIVMDFSTFSDPWVKLVLVNSIFVDKLGSVLVRSRVR